MPGHTVLTLSRCLQQALAALAAALTALLDGAAETDRRQTGNQAVPGRLSAPAALGPGRRLLRILHGRLSAVLGPGGVVTRRRAVLLVVAGVGWWRVVALGSLGRVAVGGLGALRVAAMLGRRVVAAAAALVVILRRHDSWLLAK